MTTPSTSAQGKLVPVEPTDEMLDAYWEQTGESREMRARTHAYMRRYWSAMLTASPSPAASPASPSGVRVKPLEWIGLSDSCIAHTPFGVYKVAQAGETVNMFIARSELPKSFHATLDEAKAAAQADYEARILSALAIAALSDAHQKPLTQEGEFSAADFAREFRRNHPSATIVAAGEALSLALSRQGFPMSDEAWRNTGDDAPVNSQASAEARALHRASVAFFQAVSGAADVG